MSDVNVAFALFDDQVSHENKRQIVRNLIKPRLSNPKTDPNRRNVENIADLKKITLSNCVTTRTKFFFRIIGASGEFFNVLPKNWDQDPSYINAKKIVNDLVCINDAAERNIALYQSVKDKANKEVQRQNLVQVVERSRSKFKKLRKMDVLEAYSK